MISPTASTGTEQELESWLAELSGRQQSLGSLMREGNGSKGFEHTLAEIAQQPVTWPRTAERVIAESEAIHSSMDGREALVLTGSGSSQYASECVAPALQQELGLPVHVFGGGWLLTEGMPGQKKRALLVSLARSGDSPESSGVVDSVLEANPSARHLIITCNADGRLATNHRREPRVRVITLDERTNDRSLVMTSSFTNMAVAARYLGLRDQPDEYRTRVQHLSWSGRMLLGHYADEIARVAALPFDRVVFLGTGCHFGAAREAGLKMLEMTAGRVPTLAETYLGVRHGPLCFIDEHTLVVCFLSSDPLAAAYELDLIRELNQKQLGLARIVSGANLAAAATEGAVLAIDHKVDALSDAELSILNVVIGQLLGFHRSMREGLRPDSPSEDGVISRVVSEFTVHRRNNGAVR